MNATSGYIGTLRGHFSVDVNGGAVYALPLQVPPGTARMMPVLGLIYNSGAGNDIVGMGWSLQGLSLITRVPATMAQDGFIGAVSYDENDRFALDGQRLVPVSGTSYQDPDAVYHTEIESWMKVVPVYQGTPNRSGPDAFQIYTKDGKLMEYGTSADAQVAASSANPSLRVWALNRITDLNGNSLTVSYAQDTVNNSYRPQSIDYTANANAGLASQRSVQFQYEDRPDAIPKYLGGYPVLNTQRLSQIQTFLDGAPVMTYALAYEQGQLTGRSRLTSVTQSDAAGIALTPSVFQYQDGDPAIFTAADAVPVTGDTTYGTLLPMDVNGDGIIDLVKAYSADGMLQLVVYLANSNGSGFGPGMALPLSGLAYGGQFLPMDVNGDGCMDLVYAIDNGGTVGLTVFLAAEVNGQWTLTPGAVNGAGPSTLDWGGTLLAMDVDGDGLSDIVYILDAGGSVSVRALFSNGSTFAPSPTDQTPAFTLVPGGQWVSLDYNGDGMMDLAYATSSMGSLALALFLSQGRAGFAQQPDPLPSSAAIPYGSVLAMDVNGDGLTDLVNASYEEAAGTVALTTLLSNGVGFDPQPTQSPTFSPGLYAPLLLPMEVNGDGMTDIVLVSESNNGVALNVLLATGTGFALQSGVTQALSGASWGGSVLPMDMNGDGLTDLLYATSDDYQLSLTRAMAAGPFPDLLTSITNGLGGQITPSYKPLTDPSVYSKGTPGTGQIEAQGLVNNAISGATFPLTTGAAATPGASYAVRTVDFPKYVLSGYVKADGRGNTYSYAHFYTGAMIDLTGRGWLGFASVQASDPNVGIETLTQYNQLFPKTRTPSASLVTRLSDGAWMQETALSYNPPNPNGASVPVVVNPAQVQTDFYTFAAPGSNPDTTHVLSYVYDDYGNTTSTYDSGDTNGLPVYTLETYSNDPDQWRLGYKATRVMAANSEGTQVLTSEQMAYDSTTQNLLTYQLWNDQQQQWLEFQYGYDAFGNRQTARDPSGATSTNLYDSTYHTFVAQTTTPPNQNQLSLVTAFAYYPQFGVPMSRTLPQASTDQGAATVVSLNLVDGLGRVTETHGPDPTTGNALVALTTRSWNTGQDGIYEEMQSRVDWAGDLWSWTQSYLDGLGRTYQTLSLGPDGSTTVEVDRLFDSRGRVVQESVPYYQGSAPALITRSYDGYGRITRLVQPADGGPTTTQWSYPSTNEAIKTEAVGTTAARQTTLEYGTFNSKRLVVKRTAADGGVTSYAYDPLGRVTGATDPIGVSNTVAYDSLNRQTSVTAALGTSTLHTESFTYDDLNRQINHTDGKGVQITLTYDGLKRLIGKDVAGLVTSAAYDLPGAINPLGRPATVTLPDGTSYAYGYDFYGNQTGVTLALGGTSYTSAVVYTPMHQVAELTYPDSAVLTNQFNAGGQVTAVAVAEAGGPSTTYASCAQFTALGQPQVITYGNGAQETLGYTPAGQLTSESVAVGGTALLDSVMQWNPLNLVGSITDQLDSAKSQAFTYDAVGRLKTATGVYPAQAYSYDLAGNITLKGGITYQPQGYEVQQGTQDGQVVVSTVYDADGSLTSITRQGIASTYGYDGERQLAQAGGAAFAYGPTGQRLTKQVAGAATTYYIGPHYEVTVLPGSAGTQHTKYVPGSGGPIAAITTADAGAGNVLSNPLPGIPAVGTYYLHANHLHSTTVQTDAGGTLLTTIDYQPYGEVFALSGPDVFRQKFTGKELDEETGLYYFGARYYDPSLGRFITADSILGGPLYESDVFNRYAYVLNSPLTFVDPTGHSIFSGIGHFFSHDVTHFFGSTLKGFFTGDVKSFFTNRITELVISYVVDAALIVGGVAIMVGLTPFGGAAATVLGSTLLGAGLGGLTYNITQSATHGGFSWGAWGEQLGIGAATGLIAGGFAAGAGAAADAAAGAGRLAFQAGGVARIALNVGVGGIIGNATAAFAGQVLNNLATHHSLWSGVGFATLAGGVLGGIGGAISEGIAAKVARNFSAVDHINEMSVWEQWRVGLHGSDWEEALSRIQAREVEVYIPANRFNQLILAAPGIGFTGIDAAMDAIWDAAGWPSRF